MLSKPEVIQSNPYTKTILLEAHHFLKLSFAPALEGLCLPVAHRGFGGFPANGGGLALPSPGSWRLPGQQGMAADLKDTLLKRLSHVSADHVFSLSTL